MRSQSLPRLSMSGLTTLRWSMDEDLHRFREAGFQGVGLWRRKLEDFGVERGIELLSECGLRVTNLTWAGGFTGGDAHTLGEAVEDATRAIQIAQEIDADCLTIYTGGRNCHTRRHAARLVRSALEDLLPVAEARGVTLALEPMPPVCAEGWTLLTSLEQAAELLDEYRSASLRIAFDTYHFADASEAEIRSIASKVAVVHLADRVGPPSADQQRLPLGTGAAPLGAIVDAFVEGGFEGFFDVKLVGAAAHPDGYDQLVHRSAKSARGLLARAEALAPASR